MIFSLCLLQLDSIEPSCDPSTTTKPTKNRSRLTLEAFYREVLLHVTICNVHTASVRARYPAIFAVLLVLFSHPDPLLRAKTKRATNSSMLAPKYS